MQIKVTESEEGRIRSKIGTVHSDDGFSVLGLFKGGALERYFLGADMYWRKRLEEGVGPVVTILTGPTVAPVPPNGEGLAEGDILLLTSRWRSTKEGEETREEQFTAEVVSIDRTGKLPTGEHSCRVSFHPISLGKDWPSPPWWTGSFMTHTVGCSLVGRVVSFERIGVRRRH